MPEGPALDVKPQKSATPKQILQAPSGDAGPCTREAMATFSETPKTSRERTVEAAHASRLVVVVEAVVVIALGAVATTAIE